MKILCFHDIILSIQIGENKNMFWFDFIVFISEIEPPLNAYQFFDPLGSGYIFPPYLRNRKCFIFPAVRIPIY